MLWAVSLASCEEQTEPADGKGYLTVATTSLQLDSAKGYFFVEVDSDVEWSISCSAEWITLGETEFSGAANVFVSYSANEQPKSRSAIVKVESAKANSSEILIVQRGSTSGDNTGGDDSGNDDNDENTPIQVSIDEFLEAPASDQLYKLTGTIGNTYNTEYGFFYLMDGSGNVLIYGLCKDGEYCYEDLALKDGDMITVVGKKSYDTDYGGAHMKDAEYVSHSIGDPAVKSVTVAQFVAASEDDTIYQLEGTISGNITSYYGNFDLTDATGTVYIYGLVDEFGNKVWDILDLKEGDNIIVQGTRQSHKGTPEMIDALYIAHTPNEGGSGDDGSGDDDGGNTGGSDDGGNTGGGNDGLTKYAGWAELPTEEDNSDYYYAYHMRSDKSTQRNFSVCYSAEMACPVWVACPIHSCYVGSAGRSGYSQDPEIPASVQVKPDAGTTNKGNYMNRGHMLASNMRTISSATNQQVFYYTNIAPQNGDNFNTGGGWWNDLEAIEKSEFMCADTLYTVNGCHWANKNETFNGQVVPTHFYKVFLRTKKGNSGKWVVNCSESELQCVAFYVPHTVGKTEPSRSHMISVSELEEITGHTFFSNVPNAPKDTFNASDWGM